MFGIYFLPRGLTKARDKPALQGGRWNSPGHPALYAATSYSGALREVLAHLGRATITTTQACVIVDVPDGVVVLDETPQTLRDSWNAPDSMVARKVEPIGLRPTSAQCSSSRRR